MQQFPGLCSKCQESHPPYQAQRSWAIYQGPVRNAIHRLKYNGDMALGEILARGLIQQLNLSNWNLEMIVPVPVGIARQKQRGYNQAALLARPVAYWNSLAYRPGALIKTRETRSQVGLTYEERFANVRSVFQAGGEIVDGKNILVIDDVSTSGATMVACAQALMDAGATKVYGLTLARTVHPVEQGVR
jgi:competence protein ComFC